MLWGVSPLNDLLSSNLNYRVGSYGHLLTRLEEVETKKDVDILFLGSSHSYRGFDPRIFEAAGFRSFNLGSSAQTPMQTELLVNRYLDKLNPKVIIYEVFPEAFASDGVEASCDIIANADYGSDILRLVIRQNHIKLYHTMLYAMFYDLLGLKRLHSESRIKGMDEYIKGGYVEKGIASYHSQPVEKKRIRLKKEQMCSFERILKRVRKDHIPYILVLAPVTRSFYDGYSNFDHYRQIISGYGMFLNFMDMLTLKDEKHFYDQHHLNQAGVEIFNRRLIDIITGKDKRHAVVPEDFSAALIKPGTSGNPRASGP